MADIDPNTAPAPADATILRPRPGAGRRPAPAVASIVAMPVSVIRGPASEAPRIESFQSAAHEARASPVALNDFLISGRNAILQAGAPLLTLAVRLQTTAHKADVATLRREATREMQMFRQRLSAASVPEEDSNVASYVVCTFVDATVLDAPWGAQSGWSSQSLLMAFHQETVGGEKFFQILEHVRTNPARYIDLIELLGVCLAFGFEGKYRLDERGHAKLRELQREVFNLIRDYRPRRYDGLSPRWRGLRTRNPLLRFVPGWIVAACVLVVLLVGFVWFHTL
jgi:type VI secretion system protein ImpK